MPSPREMAELVRRMVEGKEGIEFADLFAPDGIMEYPFSIPGLPLTLDGQDAIREFFAARAGLRNLFDMAEVTAEVYETDDPEVVITEIRHHGYAHATNTPYEMRALGIIRVRNGKIVHYRDYMNPLSLAKYTGRLPELISAVSGSGTGDGH
ncbi:MAG TPA: nuclear transport factor 2 family protein [Actinophytocola sp.]|uniref:nuclear transport factor 2 family protein n=1 Tax=Actinophytocola sp. TaxID=1872138 RepID=UPI002DDCE210|nr:nuclear transport factor 2 family protein [Actinophytocola sp.]HEV2780425.1 nuclear transport factor 2 family protein [Actinophytocola sp.]